MDEHSFLRQLGQVSASEVGEVFRDFVRGQVRVLVSEVMAAEVSELCGPKHSPASEHFRGGSAPGRVLIEGEREEVIRPRVRQRQSDGGSQEVTLESYRAASDPAQLQADVVRALMSGVSTREMSNVKPKSPGVGRTKVRSALGAGRQSLGRTTSLPRPLRPNVVCNDA